MALRVPPHCRNPGVLQASAWRESASAIGSIPAVHVTGPRMVAAVLPKGNGRNGMDGGLLEVTD